MKLVLNRKTKQVRFEIVAASTIETLGFDPADLSDRGDAECPFCGASIDADKIKEFGKAGKIGAQLMAVAGMIDGERGRVYLPADAVEIPSASLLKKRLEGTGEEWPGPASVEMPLKHRNFQTPAYGMTKYADLFTDRQAVALLTFSRTIREAHSAMLASGVEEDLAKAATTFLALTLDKVAGYSSSLSIWDPDDQVIKHAFGKQALPMIWDFGEVNPFADTAGSFSMNLTAELEAARGLATVAIPVASCTRGSSTDLPWSDGVMDAVFTDPPYYDNISYADLSEAMSHSLLNFA